MNVLKSASSRSVTNFQIIYNYVARKVETQGKSVFLSHNMNSLLRGRLHYTTTVLKLNAAEANIFYFYTYKKFAEHRFMSIGRINL